MADKDQLKDQERLAKLWDAYETQEKELELSIKKIATMEHKVEELNRVNTVLKKAVEDRDVEIRNLELKIITLDDEKSRFQPKFDDLTRLHKEEKERYRKLFTITEELEEDLAKMKKESEIKDKWFERNVGMFENIRESIINRNVQLNDIEKFGYIDKKHFETADLKPKLSSETTLKSLPEATGHSETSPEISSTTNETVEAKSEEPITFNTVKIDNEPASDVSKPDNEPSTKTEPEISTSNITEPTTESNEASKNETIYEFTKIPEVDPLVAESLYNAGFTDISKLKSATTEDLANVDGISPTLARKIRTDLFEI